MARLKISQVEEHIDEMNQPKVEYRKINNFTLKNDKDGAHVKMLINTASDAYFYRVHTIKMTSKTGKSYPVDVECLNDGEHMCPLCQEAAKHKGEKYPPVSFAKDTMYLPLYVLDRKDNGKVTEVNSLAIWSRGIKFYKDDLAPHSMHMPNLYDNASEIMRNGVANSKETSYRLYQSSADYNGNPIDADKDLEALKVKAGFTEDMIYGAPDSVVKVWTVGQINEALATGKFPKTVTTKAQPTEPEKEVTPAEDIEIPFDDGAEVKPRDREKFQF